MDAAGQRRAALFLTPPQGRAAASVPRRARGGAVTVAIAVGSLLGLATISYCIGFFVRSRFKTSTYVSGGGRIGRTIIGAVILGIVGLIPFLGGIVVGLAVAAGVGAALAELWVRLRAA